MLTNFDEDKVVKFIEYIRREAPYYCSTVLNSYASISNYYKYLNARSPIPVKIIISGFHRFEGGSNGSLKDALLRAFNKIQKTTPVEEDIAKEIYKLIDDLFEEGSSDSSNNTDTVSNVDSSSEDTAASNKSTKKKSSSKKKAAKKKEAKTATSKEEKQDTTVEVNTASGIVVEDVTLHDKDIDVVENNSEEETGGSEESINEDKKEVSIKEKSIVQPSDAISYVDTPHPTATYVVAGSHQDDTIKYIAKAIAAVSALRFIVQSVPAVSESSLNGIKELSKLIKDIEDAVSGRS